MDVMTQLLAVRASLEVLMINVMTAIELEESRSGTSDEAAGISEAPDGAIECDHTNMENASAMTGEPRAYCSDCRHFVYLDGRTVSVDGQG